MLTDIDYAELSADLNGDDVSLRAVTLEAFWKLPSADKRILPDLERLLHDKTPCLLGLPYIFGEIRWLAANALAAEREALGIREAVRLPNVVIPIDTMGIMRVADAADVKVRGGVEGLIDTLGILQETDKLPRYDLYLPPPARERQPLPREQRQLVPALAFG